ncbi:MAG TPA: hypothetical protein VHD34_03780 [Xanthobacteraceae bacterium]|nr:hypothetical protein [Xanthobacteraceae bacterium]
MRFAAGLIVLGISAILSFPALSEECKVIGQIAYCHDWTKDKPKENSEVDWNTPLKQYGTGGHLNSYGALDDTVPPPSYSTEAPLSYPFSNKVDLGNGAKCQRTGFTLDCKQ